MSDTVITVTASAEKYDIKFNEKVLAEIGGHKASVLMNHLRHYMDAYTDLVGTKSNFNEAKEKWKVVKAGGKVDLTRTECRDDEFDTDIPF